MNTYSSEDIGLRLSNGLAENGITYAELGSKLNVSEDIVKNWAVGRTRIPIEKACQICDLFKWPLDRLACRSD